MASDGLQWLLVQARRISSSTRAEIGARAEIGILQAAVDAYRIAIALGAATEAAPNGLGQALLELARLTGDTSLLQSSADELAAAVALAPTDSHSLSTLSAVHLQMKQPEQALLAAAAAALADPRNTAAHNNHGWLLSELGRHDEAIRAYIVGLRLDPRDAELLCNLATSTAELGQLQSAVSIFEAAIKADPNHKRARANLDAVRSFLPLKEEGRGPVGE